MKIFNNFDTNIIKKEMEEAIKTHGKDNVLLSTRYIAFWIIRWIIPLILVIIINILCIYFIWRVETEALRSIFYWILFISDIVYLYKLFNLYLDYKFDHTIITPEAITTYKQKWIFMSKLKELSTPQIRSTQAYRSWLLWNIFSYWVIEILTDWAMWDSQEDGSSQAGKTKLSYVYDPIEMRKKIMQIIKIWLEQHFVKLSPNNQNKKEQD